MPRPDPKLARHHFSRTLGLLLSRESFFLLAPALLLEQYSFTVHRGGEACNPRWT